MSKIDLILPHRLLINQSLRKETEKLRIRIKQYNDQYELERQNILKDLEETRIQLDESFEKAKASAIACLSTDQDAIISISQAIIDYSSAYFSRQLLYKKKEVLEVQIRSKKNYIHFLSSQMKEIGVEVESLRNRITLLSQNADVSEILQLIRLSGCALQIDDINNAKELLNLVTKQIELNAEDKGITWYTLQDLKRLLEQRTAFISEIQFISWVIEQKIQLSKELRNTRSRLRIENKELKSNTEEFDNEIKKFNSILCDNAKIIRFYWAKNIVLIGADIEEHYIRKEELQRDAVCYFEKLKPLREEKNNILNEIEIMKRYHSTDSYKWEKNQKKLSDSFGKIKELETEKNELAEEKERLDEEIESLIRKRSRWYEKQISIETMMEKQNAPLMLIGSKKQSDGMVFANFRIKELEDISDESKKEAILFLETERNALNLQKEKLIKEKEAVSSTYIYHLDEARKAYEIASADFSAAKECALINAKKKETDLTNRLNDQKGKVSICLNNVLHIKEEDKRFLLIKLLSESEEEKVAKASYYSAIEEEKKIEIKLQELRKTIDSGAFVEDAEFINSQRIADNALSVINSLKKEQITIDNSYNQKISDIDSQIQSLIPHPSRPTNEERRELEKIQLWKIAQEKRIKNTEKKNNDRRRKTD